MIQMKNIQEIPKVIGKWRIKDKIGEGSFGSIYSATSSTQNQKIEQLHNQQIAIKTELITNVKQMLLIEFALYKKFEGIRGFPHVIEYAEQDIFSYLAMQKFEATLDKFATRKFPNHFLPAPILLQISAQTLLLIQNIHKKGYIYRDMKPANLMVIQPYKQIFIIDFGLSKKYICNNRHIPIKYNKRLVGTPIFCSLNTHAGIQQSRRDDMESWILTNMYFSFELPWEAVANKKEISKEMQNQKIYSIKKGIQWEQYIKSINKARSPLMRVPLCFIKIIKSIQSYSFEEEPHYEQFMKLIKREYFDLVGKQMNDNFNISWDIQLENYKGQFEQQQLIKETQIKQIKKVSKINFKAPFKLKQSNQTTSKITFKNIQKKVEDQI